MRFRSVAPAALVIAACTLGAHADTFTFTPSNGNSAISFSTDSTTPSSSVSGQDSEYLLTASNGNNLEVIFYNAAHPGYGLFDLELLDDSSNVGYGLVGPQLYTGSESSPLFVPGTYNFTTNPATEDLDASLGFVGTGGTLTITAPTPEPSSLLLLGTGILGFAGIVRRKIMR